jgi:hypothetical protein
MAVQVLDMIQFSLRSNKDERITKELSDKLYTDLNLSKPSDEFPYVAGLKKQLDQEVARLKKVFFPKGQAEQITHDTTLSGFNYALPQNYPNGY